MRYQGKITSWKDEQGFGFITPNAGGSLVFVHIKSFAGRQKRPAGNEIVTYELRADAKGRAQAENVAFVTARKPAKATTGPGNGMLVVAGLFLLGVMAVAVVGKLPMVIFGWYVAVSAVTFIAYWRDKSAAQSGQWRTPESTLHLLALVGGWPGAVAAQRFLRHKSKKQSFQLMFWMTVIFNCAALGWLFSSSGARLLHSFLVTI